MAARLRHIAISVPDPEQAATFFEQAFGMQRCGLSPIGIYVTDGTLNIALLKYPGDILGRPPGEKFYGITHFGMWVDNLGEATKQVEAAGATHAAGHVDTRPGVYYEVKYKDPNGLVFDLTHSGWKGAVKDVVPASPKEAAE
jgi:methylmalonyl-CoA/ethylmalonyl-CoA epimerase